MLKATVCGSGLCKEARIGVMWSCFVLRVKILAAQSRMSQRQEREL